MKLFTLGPDFNVELNKEWILMIPEFAELVKRDKGSKGDYRGEKKLKARRELSFIYFDLDFTSPIREWDPFERREEAMKYASLTEADLDAAVMTAHQKYDELLQKSSRSLRTLRAVEKGLDQLDNYYESIDFTTKDKKGELLHDPSKFQANIERLNKTYDSLEAFRKRVAEELKGDQSIRGQASLGRKEGKRDSGWNEGGAEQVDEETGEVLQSAPVQVTSFAEIGKLLAEKTKLHSED